MNTQEKNSRKKNKDDFDLMSELMSWLYILIIAAGIAFTLNTFIIANSRIPSASMENTIMTKDRVIGARLAYMFNDPEQGDIIIFRYPDDESIYYVKRIIGMPGDIVDIKGGKVYINNSKSPLSEPYIKEEMIEEEDMHFEVPENSYFCMGDNRNNSRDSRYWNNTYVHRDKIIAKVLFRYYPNISVIY